MVVLLSSYRRYQTGLTLNKLFPSTNGFCACGCGAELSGNRRKWASTECRDKAYIAFAIVKGDNNIIRREVYRRDAGFCACCGVLSENWEADHIKAVQYGGSACDLSNFQTLCISCHQEKSYKRCHHIAISSQAVSIRANLCLYEEGQPSICCLNRSKEKQVLTLANSPSFFIYKSAY